MSMTYLALLRGVNVGGKNRMSMNELADLFVRAGCSNVRSFIQSGNVVFSASDDVYTRLPEVMPENIFSRFGFKAPVVLRTADELSAVVQSNPFVGEEETVSVAFLREWPTKDQVSDLDADRSPPDRFVVLGREIYMHLPSGTANSKLTNAYFDSKLKTVSTGRNWRTVTA